MNDEIDDWSAAVLVDELEAFRKVEPHGYRSGIPGTPAFFLNDLLFEDEPKEENFAHAIDWLLERGSAV